MYEFFVGCFWVVASVTTVCIGILVIIGTFYLAKVGRVGFGELIKDIKDGEL